ncbi:basic transcription factor 3b, putative [Hepatocystis sp. ex Piliocolobus tephrosceles]|nr:basic transcription factor 3b, putative [Hepatocystis sp. ex Piliocolobus tephrosceles]
MDKISPEILAARAKLKEKMGGNLRQIGGKGSARRTIKKVHKNSISNEKKITLTLKKLSATHFNDVDEIILYKDDNTFLEFTKPKLAVALQSNCYIITGKFTDKKLDLNKLFNEMKGSGKLNLQALEQLEKVTRLQNSENADDLSGQKENQNQNQIDEIPDLVNNFEDFSLEEQSDMQENVQKSKVEEIDEEEEETIKKEDAVEENKKN